MVNLELAWLELMRLVIVFDWSLAASNGFVPVASVFYRFYHQQLVMGEGREAVYGFYRGFELLTDFIKKIILMVLDSCCGIILLFYCK